MNLAFQVVSLGLLLVSAERLFNKNTGHSRSSFIAYG